MKITKLGHCCLLVETHGKRILTDPGAYSEAQNQVKGADIILITHEHQDHFHTDSLKQVLVNNPKAKIFTNRGVGILLSQAGTAFELLEHGQIQTVDELTIEGFGEQHAPIYPAVPEVINTGYLIDKRLFYPGDAFYEPNKPVEVLALPVAGPWMKLGEAIDYAKKLKPKIVFPVHDGMLKIFGPAHRLPQSELKKVGINFSPMEPGQVLEV